MYQLLLFLGRQKTDVALSWATFRLIANMSLNCLQGSAKWELEDPWGQHLRKNLRYFRLLPNLAQRKLIDLANHLPSSSPCGLLTVTHRAFENFEFYGESQGIFVSQLCENASLYRRMSTKYKSSKLFWRILEDNKQNKRENWSKETLRICACKSQNVICRKFLVSPYFRAIFGFFCLDIDEKNFLPPYHPK